MRSRNCTGHMENGVSLHKATISPATAEAPLVLALDVGSSSARAAVFDRLGRQVEGFLARRSYRLTTAADGTAEADARALFDAVASCVDEVLARVRSAGQRIHAVGICTFVSNVLGVNSEGEPLTPVYTYADTRPAAEVEVLRHHFDEREIHQRTGCRFHTSYLPARFLWLQRTQPHLLPRVARWISFGEFIEWRLFGDAAVSYSVASWTGLLDRHRLCWDEPLLAFLPIEPTHLSPLTDVSSPRRGLRSPYAERWPELKDVPWFPAVGDGAAANVGSGCVTPERVALTIGTTSALRVVVTGPLQMVPWGLWCYRVDGRRSLPGGALSEGGNVLTWMRRTLQLPELDELNRVLSSRSPDVHGITVLPFWAGERSPGWHENARAVLYGLTLGHTPVDLLQAGLEAVSYRLAAVFELLRPLLPSQVEIVAGGGALHHIRVWPQMLADVLGYPVVLSGVEEISARGVALLVLEALGVLNDVTEAPFFAGTVYVPDSQRHERYQEARYRQERLYRLLAKHTGIGDF